MNNEEIQRKILRLKQEQEELYQEMMGNKKQGCKGKVNLERYNGDELDDSNLMIEKTNKGYGIFAENYDNSKFKRLRR